MSREIEALDELPSKTNVLEDILSEIRGLRQAFEERNRIIDGQLAQIQSISPVGSAPEDGGAGQPLPPNTDVEGVRQAVLNELVQRDGERRVQAALETYVKIINTTYDQAAKYTNVVIVGGYAAFFALWTSTRSIIAVSQARWSIILMIISATLFVGFEVVKMIRNTEHAFALQKIFRRVRDEHNVDLINQAFKEYDLRLARKANMFIPAWRVCLYLTATTAAISLLLLLSAFVSGLFET